MQTVENQFREGYKLTKKRVTFTGRGLDPGIELDYNHASLPGWSVVEKSARKVLSIAKQYAELWPCYKSGR